ncbi:MAG: class I SAM-dependent methyltransferase [Bacteroidota bacterium]|nr:class I SAM-dependent methyltransferase [Bacteroidota bacterium]
MTYDPVKDRLGHLFGHPKLLPLFYRILHLLFLRSWYVRRQLRQLPSGARVLDAGTGFGQYAWYVARNTPDASVVAVDIKKDYLARARRCFEAAGLDHIIATRYDDVTAPDVEGPFDCILAVDIMEHLEEDVVVMKHFARLLNNSGTVIISTPSDQGGSDASESSEGFIGEHVRDGYGIEDLTSKLATAGLRVERAVYSYGPWGSLAWRLLIKFPMRLMGLSVLLAPLLAVYYVPVLPVGLFLNWLDVTRTNRTGTGLLVVARPGTSASAAKSLP